MYWEYGAYAPPLIISGVIALVSAILTWQRRRAAGSVAFAALMLLNAVWCFANTLELGAVDLEDKIFWANIEYVGIAWVPTLWLVAALQYTTWGKLPTRRQWLLLGIVPTITLALVWTNPLHGLMRKNVALDTSGSWSIITKAYGPWFWAHTAYSYLALMGGSVVLIRSVLRSSHVFRRQTLALLIGVALPWIGNIAYLAIPHVRTTFDPTPIAITISAVVADLAMLRFGLLDIVPTARALVVDGMRNALLVLDLDDRIIDMNPAAEALLQCDMANTLGQSVNAVLYGRCEVLKHRAGEDDLSEEIRIAQDHDVRYYDLRTSVLTGKDGRPSGRVMTLHDVTDRKNADTERERLIAELQDALEEVRTLSGLLPICASCKRIRDDDGYWRQLEEYLSEHSNAEFTHGICPDCIARLYAELLDGERESQDISRSTASGGTLRFERLSRPEEDAPSGPPAP